jgi:hypothetical protein
VAVKVKKYRSQDRPALNNSLGVTDSFSYDSPPFWAVGKAQVSCYCVSRSLLFLSYIDLIDRNGGHISANIYNDSKKLTVQKQSLVFEGNTHGVDEWEVHSHPSLRLNRVPSTLGVTLP